MKYLPIAVLLLAGSLAAQPVPPQSHLEISVSEDGTQGFLLRVVSSETPTEAVEAAARDTIPFVLAEKQWCLRGWTIDKKDVVPLELGRNKGTVVTFAGTCKL